MVFDMVKIWLSVFFLPMVEPMAQWCLNAQHDQLPKDAAKGEAADEIEIPTAASESRCPKHIPSGSD